MDPLVLRLGLALAIGLLVGIERGWREREAPAGSRTAGIRTYGISGLLGGVVAALSQATANGLILPLGFAAFALVFGWFKRQEAEHDEDFSATGVIAAMAVFALGSLSVAGHPTEAAAGGAALATVLASREMLHEWLKRLTWIELRSALILVVMTAVILPLLPQSAIDPWGAVNPREIWLFTILMGALSYLGYILIRIAGPSRGLIYSTLAGALVSSTAMTLSLARAEGDPRLRAGAACLAAVVSVFRMLAITIFVGPAVAVHAAPPTLAAAAVFGLFGLVLLRAPPSETTPHAHRNPLDLRPILISAAILTVMSAFSAVSSRYFGSSSLPVTAAIAGLADVDAAVLSMIRLQNAAASPELLGLAILAAYASNAIVRFASAAAIAPRSFSMAFGAATITALLTAFTVYWFAPITGYVPVT
ncbi:MAG: MgtC/SapB family protein [Rhizobiaceae bacterium]|nr:MgtC/SapB family protein [Rhizobiaceae bacterium]